MTTLSDLRHREILRKCLGGRKSHLVDAFRFIRQAVCEVNDERQTLVLDDRTTEAELALIVTALVDVARGLEVITRRRHES